MNHHFVVSFGNLSELTFLYVKNKSENFSHIYNEKNKKGVMNDVKKATKMGKRRLSFSNCPTCYIVIM